MSTEFMARAKEKGFDKWSDMAVNAYKILEIGAQLRDDIKTFILTHSERETNSDGDERQVIKSLGKLLKEKITIEGLFTVVLFTRVFEETEGKMAYKFITNNDGTCIAKSPIGMFEDMLIPNDLGYVADMVDKYNNED